MTKYCLSYYRECEIFTTDHVGQQSAWIKKESRAIRKTIQRRISRGMGQTESIMVEMGTVCAGSSKQETSPEGECPRCFAGQTADIVGMARLLYMYYPCFFTI